MAGTIYHAYCDESCTDKGHSHMVLAGILASAGSARDFRSKVMEWRASANMKSELKWTRVSTGKLLEYQQFVRMGVAQIHARSFAFRSLVVDKAQLDYKRYHDGDEERAFRRFIYLLVFNCFCPLLDADDQLVLFLDERDGADLTELCTILNRALRSRRGRQIDVIRGAQWIDSKRSAMMQLNDVLMGAVACHNNNSHLARTSGRGQAKCELASSIAAQFALQDLREQTPAWARHFGIWRLRLRK